MPDGYCSDITRCVWTGGEVAGRVPRPLRRARRRPRPRRSTRPWSARRARTSTAWPAASSPRAATGRSSSTAPATASASRSTRTRTWSAATASRPGARPRLLHRAGHLPRRAGGGPASRTSSWRPRPAPRPLNRVRPRPRRRGGVTGWTSASPAGSPSSTAASKGLGRASAEALVGRGGVGRDLRPGPGRPRARRRDGRRRRGAGHRRRRHRARRARSSWSTPPSREFGRLDILVANAGGPPPGRALDVDDERPASAALNANLLTSVRLVRAALPPHAGAGLGPHLLHHVRRR